ncbi:glycosylated lysosomal membrane protein A-like [Macrobrachium nipponense]|uniref:glycosylated lysosomal membrane protein A-like n=1 Tax=Macrobrachium nipponense TaxID=159736 RepID=UPI0030C832A8
MLLTIFNWKCWLLCAFWIFVAKADETRTVHHPEVNPECEDDLPCDKPWITYVKADGNNMTTLHHLWGAVGAPTMMVAVTDLNATLRISWNNLINGTAGSVDFNDFDDVQYAFGFVIPNIILFDDVNDTGTIDNIPEEKLVSVPMSSFTWKLTETLNATGQEQGVVFETVEFNETPLANGTKISIKVTAYGEDGRSSALPHLIHTPNSGQIGIILDHLILNVTNEASNEEGAAPISGFSNPRWAMDLVFFSMEHRDSIKKGFEYETVKSLDDEYSPGVFNIDMITTNLSRVNSTGAYMQWRPVCYLTSDLDITYSTFPHVNTTFEELNYLDDSIKKSLAYAVFGEEIINSLVSTKSVIAFGQSKDGFYTGSNYTAWTLAYGIGSPPTESFSTTVILIISLGSGIPLLVFIMGGTYVGYRKLRGH